MSECPIHHVEMTVRTYKGKPLECPRCLDAVHRRLDKTLEKLK